MASPDSNAVGGKYLEVPYTYVIFRDRPARHLGIAIVFLQAHG